MNLEYMPANILHYRELIEELREREFIRASDVFQLSSNTVDYRNSIFGLQSKDAIMLCANTKALQPYRIEAHLGSNVGLLFMSEGVNTLQSNSHTAQFKSFYALISFNMPVVGVVRTIGSTVKNLAIIVPSGALIEEYGLRYDFLPAHIQMAIRSSASPSARMLVPLSPRCRLVLDTIFTRQLIGATHHRYIRAKTEELLCELIHQLNTTNINKKSTIRLSTSERLEQRIRAAAEVYRQHIGMMPSVDHVARLVGLNRNNITSGFKDLYGHSPGEFAKTLRMQWAHEQLRHGLYAVSEISALTGYANTTSFTRAYTEFFGRNPSLDICHEPDE